MKDSTILKYVKMYKRVEVLRTESRTSASFLSYNIESLYTTVANEFFQDSHATVRNAVNFVTNSIKSRNEYVMRLLDNKDV